MPAGRPDEYTEDRADAICECICLGMSLRTISAQDGMPDIKTMYLWMRKYPEFLQQYARAKEEQADAFAEEMLDIADDDGNEINRAKLQIDTRKWLASKFKAKKYGDSTQIKHADADGGKLSLTNILAELDEPEQDRCDEAEGDKV